MWGGTTQAQPLRVGDALASAKQEDAAPGKCSCEPLVQCTVRLRRQVDGEIAAENESPLPGRRSSAEKIPTLPADVCAKLRGERDYAVVGTASRKLEVLVEQIASEQQRPVEHAEALQQDRNAVQLGTVRTTGRPDADPAPVGDESRQERAFEQIELGRITKETRHRNGNRAAETGTRLLVTSDQRRKRRNVRNAFTFECALYPLADVITTIG